MSDVTNPAKIPAHFPGTISCLRPLPKKRGTRFYFRLKIKKLVLIPGLN
jgi:hypothetical protein